MYYTFSDSKLDWAHGMFVLKMRLNRSQPTLVGRRAYVL